MAYYPGPYPEDGTFREMLEWHQRLVRGRELSEEIASEILKNQAEKLLRYLYDPVPNNLGWRAGSRSLQFADEPINWGDLHVVEAALDSILIEEAGPEATLLQAWMHDRLAEWGWNVEVRTEW